MKIAEGGVAELVELAVAPINVLLVDDSPLDAEITTRALRRANVQATFAYASDATELRVRLETFEPDVVLCDFGFPGSDGFEMQRIIRARYPAVPLIFVSGTISEDRAVMAMRTGAIDYVMKSNLLRLPTAVEHAVRETRERLRLQASLHDAEDRVRNHAERLESLWQIVNNADLRDRELLLAMLRQAATAIQPGHPYEALLLRLHENDVVVEALAAPPGVPESSLRVRVGDAIPLASTSFGRVLAEGGGTRSWDDLEASTYATFASRSRGTRSLIISTFVAGGGTWGLAFTSTRKTRKPLDQHDHAFIDIVASFFANHLQQRWQLDRIQYQQSHDVLTGLLNRSQFRSRSRAAAAACRRFAIVIVDVNDFHEVNDVHGHMVGDALLVEVANALVKRAGDHEIVGRIGSDVFGIFIENPRSREAVVARAAEFAAAFGEPFSTGDREGREFVALTASVGVATAPEDAHDVAGVLAHADLALLAAKQRGPATIALYEPGMEQDAVRRTALKNELAEALAANQFELHYQPHVEIETGIVTGCEALVRWNHPERGLLAPATFIPFAEKTGLIKSIDQWVMRNAIAAADELRDMHPEFRLYFNLSGRQAADASIVRAFTDAARSGVDLSSVGVEITESDAMRDVESTRRVCRALRRLNVKVAIDDFGTGYSSLSSLKQLPVDIVKIDRSFVSGVLSDPHDEAIAETIISISQHFGFESLAEGVEREGELAWLRARGCRYAQGFAMSPALPLDRFKRWVSEWNARRSPEPALSRAG